MDNDNEGDFYRGMIIEKNVKLNSRYLNFQSIIHKKFGKKHIDDGKFATFNHRKHLCLHYNKYFYDTKRAIGV